MLILRSHYIRNSCKMDYNHEKLYGLIGYPLGHSFSQNYFNQKFESENIDARYVNFEIPDISEIVDVIAGNRNLDGLNVTIPYKEQVLPYLDEIDDEAARIGAVNVIKFIRSRNGSVKCKGYNSDITGFCGSIEAMLRPYHRKALVLGTGGAAKAVIHGLRKLGVEPTAVSRTKRDGLYTYNELTEEIIDECKVIVNTTPIGMYPYTDRCPDIPYRYLTEKHICYDLLYNPDVTLFMKRSSEYGAQVKNGLEMLLLQAFAAWNIWQSR